VSIAIIFPLKISCPIELIFSIYFFG